MSLKLRARLPISSERLSRAVVSAGGGRSPRCRHCAAVAIVSTGRVSHRRAPPVVASDRIAIITAAAPRTVPASRRICRRVSLASVSITTLMLPPPRPAGAALSTRGGVVPSSGIAAALSARPLAAAALAIDCSRVLHRGQASVLPTSPPDGAAAARRRPAPSAAATHTPVTPGADASRFASACHPVSTSRPAPASVVSSTVASSLPLPREAVP